LLQAEEVFKHNTALLERTKEEVKHQRAELLRLEGENNTLRKGFQETLNKLQNISKDENLVDRRLVAKMLINYFERKHDNEVLDLMCRVLQFTEEEITRIEEGRRRGGLSGGIRSVTSRLFAAISPFDQQANVPQKKDENSRLSELWVDFLIQETGKSNNTPENSYDTGKHGSPQSNAQQAGAVAAAASISTKDAEYAASATDPPATPAS